MSIATVLAISFGALLAVTVIIVLGISLLSGIATTRDLLLDKAGAAMQAAESDLREMLDPAAQQAHYLADLVQHGILDVEDSAELADYLIGAMAGTPQIASLSYVTADMQVTSANRAAYTVFTADESHDPIAVLGIEELSQQTDGSWGQLTYVPTLNHAVVNFREPVIRDGAFIGAIIATISVAAIAERMEAAPVLTNGKRFILYGRDRVLTEQGGAPRPHGLSVENGVPRLEDISDPVLKNIWSGTARDFGPGTAQNNFDTLSLDHGGRQYIFVYRNLEGYAEQPFVIGYWVLNDDVSAGFQRLIYAGISGLTIMLIGVLLAILIGRRIAKPIHALSAASRRISELDFSNMTALPRSRFKEMDEANRAYNRMVLGLKWFETYVPKALVRRLMESGEARSEQRIVTVMFTDIVGFTPQAEQMDSEDVANFLNAHFQLVTACIEKEGGTVDKFIGDAVMAFWGAPENVPDHAARACQAALAIKRAVEAHNHERVAAGLEKIRMRIGLHTGPLVVGNIGSPGRLNYTVVGDTVNTAQRMEQYGKNLPPSETSDVTVLMTETTCHAAGMIANRIGDCQLRGRADPVTIFRLDQ